MNNLEDMGVSALVLFAAISGIVFICWQLDRNRRREELLDRQYDLYQRVKEFWLLTHDTNVPTPHFEDLIPFAKEAASIFGKEMQDHILSLSGKRHSGSPLFPDEDFVRPFRKYLKLS